MYKGIIYVSPFIRIFDFILGMACAYVWQLNKNKQLKHSTLWEIGAMAILTSFYFFYSSVPEVYRFSVYYWLPMLLLIFVFAYQGGTISKLLSNKYIYKLGELSFAIYMVHYPIIKVINRYIINEPVLSFYTSLVLTIIISLLLHELFEKPISKKMKMYLNG